MAGPSWGRVRGTLGWVAVVLGVVELGLALVLLIRYRTGWVLLAFAGPGLFMLGVGVYATRERGQS